MRAITVAPDRSRLMEEPASMMWNTEYGMLPHTSGTLEPISGMSMMGGTSMMGSPHSWYSAGSGAVTSVRQAAGVANRWLARTRPGEVAESDGPGSAVPFGTTAGTALGAARLLGAADAISQRIGLKQLEWEWLRDDTAASDLLTAEAELQGWGDRAEVTDRELGSDHRIPRLPGGKGTSSPI